MSAPLSSLIVRHERVFKLVNLTMASNVSVVTHSSTDKQKDMSLRAQRKHRGHQHYKKKNKVEKIEGEEKKYQIETEYYFENGLRKVYPYYFSFSSFVKGRWVGRTVEDVYMKEFRGKSQEYLISEIERGRITVNGKKVPPDFKLKHGHFLEHIVHRHENPVVGGPLQIIDNTPDLVVVNKPASIPCHPCSRFRYNTITFILGVEHGLKNLRTLYRLDRLTSGVLILPKTLKKSQRWEKQLANRELYKEYVCRVEGEFPEDALTCDEPIELLCQHIYLFKVGPKGKPSTTTFTRLSYNGKSSVVKCVPLTGRSHQIRVHLQYLGYPILNDPIYNRAVYGKNKGKGGEMECTVEEIADDIRKGTNIGRWKGDENPKYALFLANKQKADSDKDIDADNQKCSNSAKSVSKCDHIDKQADDDLIVAENETEKSRSADTHGSVVKNTESQTVSQKSKSNITSAGVDSFPDSSEQVDKDILMDNIKTTVTMSVDKETLLKSDKRQMDSQGENSNSSQTLNVEEIGSHTNTLGVINATAGDSGKTRLCFDSSISDSVKNIHSSFSDIHSSNMDSYSNKYDLTACEDEIPCKRLKTEMDSSANSSNIQSTDNEIEIVKDCSVKDNLSDNQSSNVNVKSVASESVIIMPYEDRKFDESKMTYEENCEECMYIYRDPSPVDLVLYLHAVRYKGPDWDYSAPLPDWADPDWIQEESI